MQALWRASSCGLLLACCAWGCADHAEPGADAASPTGSSIATATSAQASAAASASSEPSASLVSSAPQPSAAPTTAPPNDADCVDLVPGKIPPRGDRDAREKSRPPKRMDGRARGFDTSSLTAFRTLRDAGFDFGYIQTAIGVAKNKDFAANWRAAKACGIPRGAYQFLSNGDGAAQGRVLLEVVGDDFGELPPVLDIEKPPKCEDECCGDACGAWKARVDAWLAVVMPKSKHRPMLYYVEPFYAQCVCAATKWSDHELWLAAWPRFDFPDAPRLGNFKSWRYYQYEGNVRRYGGVIDLNLFSGNREEFRSWLANLP